MGISSRQTSEDLLIEVMKDLTIKIDELTNDTSVLDNSMTELADSVDTLEKVLRDLVKKIEDEN